MSHDEIIIETKLRSACFRIADCICTTSSTLPVEKSIEELELLFEHSERYYKYALLECIELKEHGIDPNIIYSTLTYIERHFAIPAMMNDATWFSDVLNTLLSFFTDDQNIIEDDESYDFLIQLARKISQRIQNG